MTGFSFLKGIRFQIFYALLTRRRCKLTTLGGTCSWTLCCDQLKSASIVLCAGAGNDISFELELIEKTHASVVLLDPSPTGVTTVERQGYPKGKLTFLPVGLADHDGFQSFDLPSDSLEGSFRKVASEGDQKIRFPCRSVGSLMEEFQWKTIDLLKIDIEGSEYEVLDQIIKDRLPVRQICVEFHHGPAFGFSRHDTVRRILALWRAGYRLVHRVNWDHTFILGASA